MKYKYFQIITVIFFGILLFSCMTAGKTNLLQKEGTHYTKFAYEDYRLQMNDIVFCNILTSETELANEFNGVVSATATGESGGPSYRILENGCILVPFFGEVKIEGCTINEAEIRIREKMQKSFPDAEVIVRLSNNSFFIYSSTKAGKYYMDKENMTIFQALAATGAPDEIIDYSKVRIVRVEPDGRTVEKTFDLRAESIIDSEFYYIKPNDVIYYKASTARSFFGKGSTIFSVLGIITTPALFFFALKNTF